MRGRERDSPTLATAEVKTVLPPGLAVARDFARQYLTQLCHLGDLPAGPAGTLVEPPAEPDLGALALAAATELEISQPRALGAGSSRMRSSAVCSASSWQRRRARLPRLQSRGPGKPARRSQSRRVTAMRRGEAALSKLRVRSRLRVTLSLPVSFKIQYIFYSNIASHQLHLYFNIVSPLLQCINNPEFCSSRDTT